MDKAVLPASDILLDVGGENNILCLENCMIRVRMEAQDDGQIDIPHLRQLPGVNGHMRRSTQHQIIIGPGRAAKVVDAMRSLIASGGERAGADDVERAKSEAKAKYKALMSSVLRKSANALIPLISVFITSGLITGIINTPKRPDIVGDFAIHYPNTLGLTSIFGNAIFAITNILAGVNIAKALGGSLAMGGVTAGILSNPQLAQAALLGEALQPGCGGVITVLLVVALMCQIERKFRASLLESLELILNPLLTTTIVGVIAIVALQPLGGWVSELIAYDVFRATDRGGSPVDAMLAGTFLSPVLTGPHRGLVSIHVEPVQAYGYSALSLTLTTVGVGQIGTVITASMKIRNARLKKVTEGALPVGLLGIGEPLILSVTLLLGKPLIGVCLGDAVGGVSISYWKVATVTTFGISGLSLVLTIVVGKVMFHLLGYLVAVLVGFLFAWLLGFTDPEE